jgi:DNA modification methylase
MMRQSCGLPHHGAFCFTRVLKPGASIRQASSLDGQPTPEHLTMAVRAELTWEGKYGDKGKRVSPLRVTLPFQTVETVNESSQERQRNLFQAESQTRNWRNRLIWGDKKYVLPSLLPEFAGKVDLIYIDPPFDTGADFSFVAAVPGVNGGGSYDFTKQPSIIEQKAYRDTWGRGIDSYLQWFYETVVLLHELLAEGGSLYVHLDWHVGHYAKVILDEVVGPGRFISEVIWYYSNKYGANSAAFDSFHNTLYLYSKGPRFLYNPIYVPVKEPRKQPYRKWNKELGKNEWQRDELGNYIYVESTEKELADVWEVPVINPMAKERLGYDTQKPEALLERVIKASSNEGDLVLDCFVGSGTTAAVAERLHRRWIACDLSRFAIHTTRKRLLNIREVRPFVVQNLGRYERQAWQASEFSNGNGSISAKQTADRQRAYIQFILSLYQAKPIQGYAWLHGVKNGRMVHVGAVDAPVSDGDIRQVAAEFRRSVGTGNGAPTTNDVDVLGWDFAFELQEVARQQAAAANIRMAFKRIPREVMDKRAVEQGDIRFFELAALAEDVKVKGCEVTVTLTNFIIPPDDVPEDVRRAVKHWSQWIDFWAIDWDYKGDTFHNEWQSYRTRKGNALTLAANHTYPEPGERRIMVKVIDILGNDTTKVVKAKAK